MTPVIAPNPAPAVSYVLSDRRFARRSAVVGPAAAVLAALTAAPTWRADAAPSPALRAPVLAAGLEGWI